MWLLPLLGYAGLLIGFAFLTLAIASGLYYLSELVEEHTVFTKKLLSRLIYGVIAIQFLLGAVDRFPITLCALSIASHFIYLQNLRRFPIVKLTGPVFIVSCVLVLINHYVWFRHFSAPPQLSGSSSSHPYRRLSPYDSLYDDYPTFTEIASFFGICVWLIPFCLFVSLSAGENVLPSMGSEYATGEGSSFTRSGREPALHGMAYGKGGGHNAGMAKALVDGVRNWFAETSQLLGVSAGNAQHRF